MSKSLRIIFAGTPDIASYCLEQLIKSTHKVIAVFTSPDKFAGRGMNIKISKVKEIALKYKLPIFQPITLLDKKNIKIIKTLNADIMIIIAYGLIIPKNIINLLKFGGLNVHGSLLPKWRGAAPIQYALLNGDKYTGVSIIKIDSQLDTGVILDSIKYKINPYDTSKSLLNKFKILVNKILLTTLQKIIEGNIVYKLQSNNNITYAKKIKKIDVLLDWKLPAVKLECSVRAFNPWPISYFKFKNYFIKVWKAIIYKTLLKNKPGTILNLNNQGIEVATSYDNLIIEKLQFPNKKIMFFNELGENYKKLFIKGIIL